MNRLGMTRIELLVVALIVGVLGIGAVIAVSNARSQTRDAVRLSDIRQVQAVLELYYNDFNTYPEASGVTALGQASTRCLSEDGFSASCTLSLETVYMETVPSALGKGLKSSSSCSDVSNAYCYLGSETGYEVEFELENNNSILGVQKGVNCATPSGIEPGSCSL